MLFKDFGSEMIRFPLVLSVIIPKNIKRHSPLIASWQKRVEKGAGGMSA